MREIIQEHEFGCAVACVASILDEPYSLALARFTDGEKKATLEGFYCRDIAQALGANYTWRACNLNTQIPPRSIVFVSGLEFPFGHYLAKVAPNLFMNPWINIPLFPIEAGFTSILPGTPTWLIYPSP